MSSLQNLHPHSLIYFNKFNLTNFDTRMIQLLMSVKIRDYCFFNIL